MSYPIEFRLASKNGWHTPAEAKAYYGRYSREGITIHWWGGGEGANKHDNIVNYFLGQGEAGTKSVNYVVSDNKITLMVGPDNVAWCSQSGNPTTVSIECQPTLGAEGYKKVGWLVNELEGRYNRGLRLYPHNHWASTACPGSIDLNRIRAEADKWKSGGYAPQPVPVPVPTPNPTPPVLDRLTWRKWDEGKRTYVFNKDANLWNFNSDSWNMQPVKQFKKGELFEVYGQCTNNKIKATYYLTEYSFNRKITNGVNPADLDVYAPPVPVPPTPPPSQEPTPLPPNPAPPVEPTIPDKNAIIAFLESIVTLIVAFVKRLKGEK